MKIINVMPKFFFPNGAATKTGAYVIVQVMHQNGELFDGNLFADYKFDSKPDVFGTNWTAMSICYYEKENTVFASGGNGEIVIIRDSGNQFELISPTENGPEDQGFIREIRLIGNELFAVGMGRQVYRRIGERHWEHIDKGVLDLTGRSTVGFTSIAGDGQGFLVAVGYEGEIWEFNKVWKQITSPTNLLLNRVIAHEGKYYAAGLIGILLCREMDGWHLIDNDGFEEDVWDLETFRGDLYLGTSRGLFLMSPDEKVKPVNPLTFTRQVHCGSLSAGYDHLWCFGAEIVSTTTDGVVWREEKIITT
jgi:hypothetical protein